MTKPLFFSIYFLCQLSGASTSPYKKKEKVALHIYDDNDDDDERSCGCGWEKTKTKKTKNQKHFGQKLLFMLWCCEWEESLMQKNPIPKEWGSVFPPTTTINFFPRWLFLHANTSFTSKESLESLQSHSFFLFPLLLASSQLFVQLSYS